MTAHTDIVPAVLPPEPQALDASSGRSSSELLSRHRRDHHEPDTTCTLGRLRLDAPIMIASGPWSEPTADNAEAQQVWSAGGVGAMVTKTITLDAIQGRPGPVRAVDGGIVNRIGMRNPGAHTFVRQHLPQLLQAGVPLIVSVAAASATELAELLAVLDADRVPEIRGIELNLSCPNEDVRRTVTEDPEIAAALVAAARSATTAPIVAKLAYAGISNLVEVAAAAAEAGADAVTLINTVPALSITPAAPGAAGVVADAVAGGLSGMALRPLALRAVWEVAHAVDVAIIGCGGIDDVASVRAFMAAGATAVQIGTAAYEDPAVPVEALGDLRRLLRRADTGRLDELVHRPEPAAPRPATRTPATPARARTAPATELLLGAVADTGASLVVGLDPDPHRLPDRLAPSPAGIQRFCEAIIDATSDIACAYKLNSAFFEVFGPAGVDVLCNVIRAVPGNRLALVDAKRGDVGNTADRYADAIYDTLDADACTVLPWMGPSSLAPFFAFEDRLTFVVAASTNPDAGWLQDATGPDGESAATCVARHVEAVNGSGAVRAGIVAPATRPAQLQELASVAPTAPVLSPGIGAQGGSASVVCPSGRGAPVLYAATRSIIHASTGEDFAACARTEAQRVRDQITLARAQEANR